MSDSTLQTLNKIAQVAGRVLSFVAGLLAALFLIFGGFALYDSLYIQQSAKANWDTLQYRPAVIDDPDARLTPSELKAINDDYRAWIAMYETNIDYPVMQAEDDIYYVSHNEYKEASLSGAIYLAADNSPDFSDAYNLLYGHHMDNGAMFGDLDKYADKAFFDGHREGILVTETQVYDLYVFALVQTDAYEDAMYVVGNKDLSIVLSYAATHALQYDAGVKVGNQIIALSTCTSATTSGRLVLLATMTLRGGEPVNPDEPVDPDGPDNPDKPDNPDEPSNQGNQGNQGQPSVPGNQGDQGNQGQPSNPGNQGNQGQPNVPGGQSQSGIVPDAPSGQDSQASPSGPDAQPDQNATADEGALQPETELAEPESPIDALEPRVNEGSLDNWALLNLIATLFTVYLALPLGSLKAKLKRYEILKKNAENLSEDPDREAVDRVVGRISRKYHLGLVAEAILAVGAVVFFIVVTDFRQPMVIINRYTLMFLAILAACWIVERFCVRFCVRTKPRETEGAGE